MRYHCSLESELEFVLFNDTWSQKGHLVSCMTVRFPMFAKSPDRTSGHMIADGH